MLYVGGNVSGGASLEDLMNTAVSSAVFLKRLRRLLVLRYQAARYLDTDDIRLLDRCIYATYCDSRDLGVEEEAKSLLGEARNGISRPARNRAS